MNVKKTILGAAVMASLSACMTNQGANQSVVVVHRPIQIAQVTIDGRQMFVSCASDCPTPTPKVIDTGSNTVDAGPAVSQPPMVEPLKQPPVQAPVENRPLQLEPVPTASPATMPVETPTPQDNGQRAERKTVDPLMYGEVLRQLTAQPQRKPDPGQAGEITQVTGSTATVNEPVKSSTPDATVTPLPAHNGKPSSDMAAANGIMAEAQRSLVTINFQFDSSNLTPESAQRLSSLVPDLKTHEKIVITGYTSAEGLPVYNQYLALQRAVRVSQELQKAGVSTKQLVTTPRANCCYIADNATEADRSKNRRVEITISGTEGAADKDQSAATKQTARAP